VLPALVEDGYIVHSLTSGYAATQDGSALGGGRKELREEDENWDSPHTLYMGICRLDAAHPYRRIDLKAANNATLPYAFICFTGAATPFPAPDPVEVVSHQLTRAQGYRWVAATRAQPCL
jgi:hypothetical protein